MTTEEPLLQINNLTKRFPQVLANDQICLEIKKGEIHCLLGENGAGKSTLAECLYGFFSPDSGKIIFKGKEIKLASPSDAIRLGIGMVHQHFVLVQPLNVLENIVVGKQSTRFILDLSEAEAQLIGLCNEYGIKLDLYAKIWQLSVGEQQWVEILKALYGGVELLILDEPTAVLTPQESDKLFAILRRMKEEGISIIFITHKLKEVMEISDRVTVLRKGKLVGTVQTPSVTVESLAKMMVGRDVVFRVEKEKITPGDTILDARNLYAINDKGQEALHDVSLTVCQNEILGIAGVSGNGQKEFFEILVGVRKPTRGQLLFNGKDLTGCSPQEIMKNSLAHIPEDRIKEGLISEFTIEENLVLGLHRKPQFLHGAFLDFDNIHKYAQDCIKHFEIVAHSPRQMTKTLSGGNLQKVILARELSQHPKCLIANQPTRGLDVGAMEYIYQSLLEQRKNGVGILLFSEDLDEIFNLADRIAVFFRGEVLGIFKSSEINLSEVGLLMAGIR
jgi:simple sugar transport system ATP-binding protein